MPHIAKQTAAHIPSMQMKPGRDHGKGSSPAAPQAPKGGGSGASKSGGSTGKSGGGTGKSGGGTGKGRGSTGKSGGGTGKSGGGTGRSGGGCIKPPDGWLDNLRIM